MSDTKILLAEDDINLGNLLREYLNAKGYETHLFENGVLALKAFMSDKFTLCVFDIMMPEMDGLTLAREVRQVDSKIPIIFLTAKGAEEDILEGFRTGADDYITKPFSIEELVYRIKAIQKRTETGAALKDFEVFQIGKYTFDSLKQTLSLEGEMVVSLTTKESELLSLLCKNNNEILERNYALKAIWLNDNYFNARSMDVYITRLRKYLKDDPSVRILNVHGKGYKLLSQCYFLISERMLILYRGNLPSKRGISLFTQEMAIKLFPEVEGYSSRVKSERALRRNLKRLLHPIKERLDRNADEITDLFFKNIPNVKNALESDADFIFENDPASTSIDEVILSYPGFYAILVYRIANSLAMLNVPLIPRIMTEYAHSKMGIDIHPKARIDSPFFIDHGTGIVIGETAIIGKRVQLYQGVTIGALSVKKELCDTKRHPTIEDNVIIYAGSTILGGDTILGHDSIIGGNVWLTESIPAYSLVYHQHEMKIRQKSDSSIKKKM